MSHLQKQNPAENAGRYRVKKLPTIFPKCKQETLISVKQLKITIHKEPDAQTQSR